VRVALRQTGARTQRPEAVIKLMIPHGVYLLTV